MEEEHELGIEEWDELFGLYRAYCAELNARKGVEYPRKTREEFSGWYANLTPRMRADLASNWRKGLRQVIAEGNVTFACIVWGTYLGESIAGVG